MRPPEEGTQHGEELGGLGTLPPQNYGCKSSHKTAKSKSRKSLESRIRQISEPNISMADLGEPGFFTMHISAVVPPYHAPGNKFERFRGFFGINQQIRIRILSSRKLFFLKDSNFWCVHVNVPWLVCTHAIPFRMLWCP